MTNFLSLRGDNFSSLRGDIRIVQYAILLTSVVCISAKSVILYGMPAVHSGTAIFVFLKIFVGGFAAAGPEIALTMAGGLIILAILSCLKSTYIRFIATFLALSMLFIIILLNIANIELIKLLGKDLSLGLLYFSDIFGSFNGRIAVFTWIPPYLWMFIGGVFASIGALAVLSRSVPRQVEQLLLWCAIGGLGLVALVANGHTPNVGYVGVQDVVARSGTLSFLNSFRDFTPSDSGAPIAPLAITQGNRLEPEPIDRNLIGKGAVRNVVLVVLESTAAQYLDIYGGRYSITPELNRLLDESLIVPKAYSHDVATSISLAALLTATYPWISVKTITSDAPQIKLPNLPTELRRRGWRTAFFHSSDTRHSQVDRFLSNVGFDLVQDYRGRECSGGTIVDQSEFYSQATIDACTFKSLGDWIQKDSQTPFFAVLWTFQQHYPYFRTNSGAERQFDLPELDENIRGKQHKTRYLNAIAEADHLIGQLVRQLRAQNILSNTLIVITGDHGEAFGGHGNSGHGVSLYEEDVRVPLVLINPLLFHKASAQRAAGHVDIAPTVLDVLGIEIPPAWQGNSLFREKFDQPIYFFTAWADYLVGNRTGDRKTIFHWLAQKVEVYDLARDPDERENLADKDPVSASLEAQKIRSWVGQQNRIIKSAIDSR